MALLFLGMIFDCLPFFLKYLFAFGGQGGFFEKPHCVAHSVTEHLQCQDGVRRFKRHIVSMDIP
jgi:hypothetical protein